VPLLSFLSPNPHSKPEPQRQASGGWRRLRRAAAELTPETIERIAYRVAELLRHDSPKDAASTTGISMQLLDASQLARQLGVTRAWVYEHANELGVIALGDGPRPRLRFDPEVAAQALQARRQTKSARPQPASEASRPGRPRRRPSSTVPLLPVYEPRARRILSRFAFSRRSRH
jgi:hypothetical protein